MTDSDNDGMEEFDARWVQLEVDKSARAETARHTALHESVNRLGFTAPERRYMAAMVSATRLSGRVGSASADELVTLARGVEEYLQHG
jgi:hypothetical protein